MQLVPPSPKKCQCCAVEHDVTEPHNAQSLFYKVWFTNQYKRSPTWADAMAHCTEEVQAEWTEAFVKIGVDISSTNLTGNIKSQQELNNRLLT